MSPSTIWSDELPDDGEAADDAAPDPGADRGETPPAFARGTALLEVLEESIERRASDVLLTVGAPILWRIDGELLPATATPVGSRQAQDELFGLLEQEQIGVLQTTRELDFSLRVASGQRFRVNAYWQKGGVAAAFRLVPSEIPSLRDLGLPANVAGFAAEDSGLVVVTGPTGHGKSTTLASIVDLINHTRRVHVITIEDPVEFEHRHGTAVVDQREVGSDTLSFAEALRRCLRQSPDVIMVGEMRDRETISAALTAAETGHLVLATLHTNDAAQTIDRIIDVFPPQQQPQIRGQLSQVLTAVISQRLLPHKSGTGRVLACELLIATPAVRHLIREDKVHSVTTTIETGQQHGMVTLDRSLRELIRAGKVTREAALPLARDPERLPHKEGLL